MQGNTFKSKVLADGKIVIVTGSNCGIGKETVRDLAHRKATIYMVCRDIQKCEEARKEIILETKNRNIFCRECDLSSQQSIRNFVKRFKAEQSRLDILINNAGVMRCPRSVTKEGIELQLGVNHIVRIDFCLLIILLNNDKFALILGSLLDYKFAVRLFEGFFSISYCQC